MAIADEKENAEAANHQSGDRTDLVLPSDQRRQQREGQQEARHGEKMSRRKRA